MKFKLNEQTGMMEQVNEERQGVSLAELDLMDLGGPEHLTMEQRRARVATYRQEVDAPLERGFRTYLRAGKDHLDEQTRALSVVTGSAGEFLIPSSMAPDFQSMVGAADALYDTSVSSVFESSRGSEMTVPVLDNATGTAPVVAENITANVTDDIAFDKVTIPAAGKFQTRFARFPWELVADSAYPLETILMAAFAGDLARSVGAYLEGLLRTQTTLGVVATSTLNIGNIFDLFASVDSGYLASPRCGWAMNKTTFAALLKINTGNILLIEGDHVNGYEMLGAPVFFSPSVASIAGGAKSIYFGDFGRMQVRRVAGSLRVQRFGERFAELGEVGFKTFVRLSAALAKGTVSGSGVKHLISST